MTLNKLYDEIICNKNNKIRCIEDIDDVQFKRSLKCIFKVYQINSILREATNPNKIILNLSNMIVNIILKNYCSGYNDVKNYLNVNIIYTIFNGDCKLREIYKKCMIKMIGDIINNTGKILPVTNNNGYVQLCNDAYKRFDKNNRYETAHVNDIYYDSMDAKRSLDIRLEYCSVFIKKLVQHKRILRDICYDKKKIKCYIREVFGYRGFYEAIENKFIKLCGL